MLNHKWVRGKNLRVLNNTVIKPANLSGMKIRSTARPPAQKIKSKNTIDNRFQSNVTMSNISKKRSRDEYENVINEESDEMSIDDTPTKSTEFEWGEFNTLLPVNNVDVNSDIKELWVSATKSANYLLHDTLLDWLTLYYDKLGYNEIPNEDIVSNTFTIDDKEKKKRVMDEERKELSLILQGGLEFEDRVNKEIEAKYPNDVKRVVVRYITQEDYHKTVEYMKTGIPVIIQAAVYNFQNKTNGVIDLLVRSDYINRLVNSPVLSAKEEHLKAPLLNGNYHYVVIDIKWSGMHLRSNEPTLRNVHRFKAYKGQLAIYNAGIGLMQGYTSSKAYILGKSWKREYTRNKQTFVENGYDCFDRLGVIDFNGYDKNTLKDTHEAIQWIRNVRFNGNKWSCVQPIVSELYPNMNNRYDAPFHAVKKDLALLDKELTLISHVEIKHRKYAHNHGIKSWDDPRCNAKNMGFNNGKIMHLVDKIIDTQRGDRLINPEKITNNIYDWKTATPVDFYMDFEDAQMEFAIKKMDIHNAKSDHKLLFMAGLVYSDSENNQKKYRCFVANQLNREEEQRLISEMITFINQFTSNHNKNNGTNLKPRIFHWSQAEPLSFRAFNQRYNNAYAEWVSSVIWIDMHKIFKDNNNSYANAIIVKDAFGFSLKKINNAMYNHGMVQTQWPSNGPGDGLGAMTNAVQFYCYKENPNRDMTKDEHYNNVMRSIIEYNEVDCGSLYEIVDYLRKNH